MEQIHIGILLFDRVEVLDFAGPYEVFSITRYFGDDGAEVAPLRISLIANESPVTSVSGMRLLPDFDLQSCPELDVLLVPGGPGVHAARENPELVMWVAERSRQVQMLASVCTGAYLLAKAGCLKGRRATTHWDWVERLQPLEPTATLSQNKRVEVDGNLYTSGGVTAGIDLALRLVEELLGAEVAERAAQRMEYFAPPESARVRRD